MRDLSVVAFSRHLFGIWTSVQVIRTSHIDRDFGKIYAVMKSAAMSGKALAVSVSAGIIAHVLLIAAMGLQKAGLYGATGVLVFDLIVIASAPVIGWVGSKFLGPVALKPLSAA